MSIRISFFLRSAFIALVMLLTAFGSPQVWAAHLFVDCSQTAAGDGTQDHPWNRLDAISAETFQPGDSISLRRGTVCNGSLALHGSGSAAAGIRLTAFGEGPRPRIVAAKTDTQAVVLKNGEYWQIDSLDIAGGNTYGLLITGDQDKVQSNITLRNLVVHDVFGGDLHNKDNGLVVFLRGSKQQRFDHVLIENVTVAHTNQWAGIMMGAGNFYAEENDYNRDIVIRNSVAHDVYGDGIILFRVRSGLIDSSTAWLTGQQPTQNVGTPNAIWTWSCTDCTVRNSESFLTESPGVDGGAYDIDWATTRNTVENNYAHDTQGYCVAVFGAGYVTHDAVVRNNVCVDNGLSPRMSRTEGAIYIYTWNGGRIDGITVEKNLIDWNPPTPGAPVVNDDGTRLEGDPIAFRDNVIRSTSPLLLRSFGGQLVPANNRYEYTGLDKPSWFWNSRTWDSLEVLQAAGAEKGSTLHLAPDSRAQATGRGVGQGPRFDAKILANLNGLDGRPLPSRNLAQYRLVAHIDLRLDADGLIDPEVMAQLSVLRTLTREYNERQLEIVVFVTIRNTNTALHNALLDLDAPGIHFVRAAGPDGAGPVSLVKGNGMAMWQLPKAGNFNPATVGYAVRRLLGTPIYAQMDQHP
ncbi:MAG: right-handed parallel beta-helix repeat-containing protein [Acidobacteriaceae bacterium]